MFNLFASAYPATGVRGALIGIDVTNEQGSVVTSTRIAVDAGGYENSQLDLSTMPESVSMTLSVESNGKTTNIYARNVPRDGELYVLGATPSLFTGKIRHAGGHIVACTLRCTLTSKEVTGPGCIDCRATPQYEVCCG